MLDYKKYLYISPNIMPAAQDFLEVAKGKDSKNTFYEHRDLDILFIKLYYYKNTYAITNKEVNGKRVIDILCDYYCYNEPPKLMKSMEGYSDSGHIMLRKWRLKKRLHHEILRLKNFNIEDHNCDIHHLGYTFDNRLKSIVPLDDVTHGRVTKIYDPNINIVRKEPILLNPLMP